MDRIAAALALVALIAAGRPDGAEAGARDVLDRFTPLSADDWREIEGGAPVIRNLPSIERKEIAVVVVAKTRATAAAFRRWAVTADALRNDDVVELGFVGSPPQLEDFAGLNPELHAIRALKECRPGECAIKVSSEAIERVQRSVDWAAPDVDAVVAGAFRTWLFDVASAYRLRGHEALPAYNDRKDPVRLADELPGVLGRLPVLAKDLSSLEVRLRVPHLPVGSPDRLYWSKERFWRRQVVMLTHLTTEDVPADRLVVVATKLLYANHYFESLVRLTALVEGDDSAYLVDLSRTRSDHKRGGFNFLERALVERLLRKRLERQTAAYRARLEAFEP